jgi:hypothetical protein
VAQPGFLAPIGVGTLKRFVDEVEIPFVGDGQLEQQFHAVFEVLR